MSINRCGATRLEGKVAVITGGAGSIGQATGCLFSREGARVVLVDIDQEALEKAALRMEDGTATYVMADVADSEQTRRAIETAIETYDRLDIFVSNAGYEGVVKPITEYPLDVFDQVMALNVRAVWLGLKYAIPEMQRCGGGSIIITSSISGLKGTVQVSPYVTSKHAVIGMMRSAALECAPLGIRVNTVNPSPVEGRMMDSLEEGHFPCARERARKTVLKSIPLNRYATPEEVAHLMLFLASDESRFCTGGVYMVDGGSSAF